MKHLALVTTGVVMSALLLGACSPQVVEVEKEVVVTQIVEVEKEVEKVVEVEVEKIVEVEVETETISISTPTPPPAGVPRFGGTLRVISHGSVSSPAQLLQSSFKPAQPPATPGHPRPPPHDYYTPATTLAHHQRSRR